MRRIMQSLKDNMTPWGVCQKFHILEFQNYQMCHIRCHIIRNVLYIKQNFVPDPRLKLNETGRQLRLFAVDRWDSGLYMCSTSLTEPPHHNVTVRVRGPPVVTAPRHGDRASGFVARQALGHPVKLRCKVRFVRECGSIVPLANKFVDKE